MQLTIIADKLPHLSVEEFKHEFRSVHASDTKEAASSLGLITQYIQGLYLPSAIDGATPLPCPPLPEHRGPYQSLAQLTWPSVEILQGALQSPGYRNSAAAKHEFAGPKHLFLTERLEPGHRLHEVDGLGRSENLTKDGKLEQRPVALIAALTPKPDLDETKFRERWTRHADVVMQTMVAACLVYRRNAVIKLPEEQVRAVFAGTQFPAERCWSRGGYDEFVFSNIDDAQSFCSQHGEEMRRSYAAFCDLQESWCAGFDYVEQWGQADIGWKQRAVGTVLKVALSTTAWLGL